MTKAKKKVTKKAGPGDALPKRVYLWEDQDGALIASPGYDCFDDGDILGIYDLVNVARLKNAVTLEPLKK